MVHPPDGLGDVQDQDSQAEHQHHDPEEELLAHIVLVGLDHRPLQKSTPQRFSLSRASSRIVSQARSKAAIRLSRRISNPFLSGR